MRKLTSKAHRPDVLPSMTTDLSTDFPGIDPDQPIFRIFPLWYFEEALRLRQLVLVRPRKWQDPFDREPIVVVTDKGTNPWTQSPVRPCKDAVFGQCWSATKDSDTLWRAYSRVLLDPHANRNVHPSEEGVQVATTPRKLLKAVRAAPEFPNGCWLIRPVRYEPAMLIGQYIADAVGAKGLDAFVDGESLTELLVRKRVSFAHESEIRLFLIDSDAGPNHNELAKVSIDPIDLFDEVAADPRLVAFERIEREEKARSLGYTGSFRHDDLYQNVLYEIVLEN